MTFWRVVVGDALEQLRELEDGSVQTCVTSPPYFGLRDYGTGEWAGGDDGCDHVVSVARPSDKSTLERHGGNGRSPQLDDLPGIPYRDLCGKCGATRTDSQVGLEATPDEYVARLVEVFREVRRVLRDDGTLWLNLGDSYYSPTATQGRNEDKSVGSGLTGGTAKLIAGGNSTYRRHVPNLKPKDLLGIPWMVAFALRADGWYLRSDIVWAKPNPMPESVTDRPTKSHEYVFLLSKSKSYFYDADSIREDLSDWSQKALESDWGRKTEQNRTADARNGLRSEGNGYGDALNPAGRNKRSVWTVATAPFPGAHFAVFPPKLIEPCVKAGSAEGTTVLDCFSGAGTTGLVATRLNRSYIGIELNPAYAEMSRDRIRDDAPLMNYILEQEEVTPTTYASRASK